MGRARPLPLALGTTALVPNPTQPNATAPAPPPLVQVRALRRQPQHLHALLPLGPVRPQHAWPLRAAARREGVNARRRGPQRWALATRRLAARQACSSGGRLSRCSRQLRECTSTLTRPVLPSKGWATAPNGAGRAAAVASTRMRSHRGPPPCLPSEAAPMPLHNYPPPPFTSPPITPITPLPPPLHLSFRSHDPPKKAHPAPAVLPRFTPYSTRHSFPDRPTQRIPTLIPVPTQPRSEQPLPCSWAGPLYVPACSPL